jgi:hypothetical protein
LRLHPGCRRLSAPPGWCLSTRDALGLLWLLALWDACRGSPLWGLLLAALLWLLPWRLLSEPAWLSLPGLSTASSVAAGLLSLLGRVRIVSLVTHV